MTQSYASTVIAAGAERVWEVVRDFDGLPTWHPGIASSEIEEGRGAAEVGCVRHLTLPDGSSVRERLLTLDDVGRSYTYEILRGPFSVRRYRATIRVAPVTETGRAFVEWYAHYDAEAADEAELDETFASGVFASGLRGLSEYLAG